MATFTFTIPADALTRIQDAFAYLYRIPMTEPVFDPEDPDIIIVPSEPMYTKAQWAKLRIRHWIQSEVFRAEARSAVEQTKSEMDKTDLGVELDS